MKQILIVDDSDINISYLKMLLKDYLLDSALSGKEMWVQLEQKIPDLILMDVIMPEEDGYELAGKLSLNENYKDIPIIFLTARDSSEDLEKGFEAGAVDYIKKPVDARELKARIKSVLKIKDLENKLNSALNLIRQDLNLARRIQSKILSSIDGIKNGLRIYTKYLPMVEVGGDFYYITELSPGRTRIFLADATGHGIQSALITMLIKSEYGNLAERIHSPADLLNALNNIFVKKYQSLTSFFSSVIVDIDLNKGSLTYSSAGHPEQVLISEGKIEFLRKTGRIIGVIADNIYEEVTLKLNKGDRLFLFTDGIFEEFNEKDEIYKEEDVYEILEKNAHNSIKDNINFLLSDVKEFMGKRQQNDDITVIGIELIN